MLGCAKTISFLVFINVEQFEKLLWMKKKLFGKVSIVGMCIAHHRPFFNFTNRNLIQFHFLLSSSIMFQQRPAFHLISNFSFERHRFIPKAYIQRPVKRKAWTCVPIFSCPGSSLPVPLVPESNFKFNFGPIAWVSILSGDILSSVILSRLTCSEFGPMSSTHMNILVEKENRKDLYRTTFLQAA